MLFFYEDNNFYLLHGAGYFSKCSISKSKYSYTESTYAMQPFCKRQVLSWKKLSELTPEGGK